MDNRTRESGNGDNRLRRIGGLEIGEEIGEDEASFCISMPNLDSFAIVALDDIEWFHRIAPEHIFGETDRGDDIATEIVMGIEIEEGRSNRCGSCHI